jgi:hypothetical protein
MFSRFQTVLFFAARFHFAFYARGHLSVIGDRARVVFASFGVCACWRRWAIFAARIGEMVKCFERLREEISIGATVVLALFIAVQSGINYLVFRCVCVFRSNFCASVNRECARRLRAFSNSRFLVRAALQRNFSKSFFAAGGFAPQ